MIDNCISQSVICDENVSLVQIENLWTVQLLSIMWNICVMNIKIAVSGVRRSVHLNLVLQILLNTSYIFKHYEVNSKVTNECICRK